MEKEIDYYEYLINNPQEIRLMHVYLALRAISLTDEQIQYLETLNKMWEGK